MLDRLVGAPFARLSSAGHVGLPAIVACLIVAAWLLAVAAHLGGWSESLSHDRLIDGGSGLLQSVGAYVVGWQLMVAAMMMPSMLSASRRFEAVAHRRPRRRVLRLAFLGGYLVRLTVFGVAMLIADLLLHDLVEVWPWLGARPWVIGGTALIMAGGFVLVGLSVRLPTATESGTSEDSLDPVRATRMGADQGLRQLRGCWPMMVLSFAMGMTNLVWMAALTGVMVLAGSGKRASRVVMAFAGVMLLSAGLLVFANGGWPPILQMMGPS